MTLMSRPVHFEIPADDPEKLTLFYRQLFGWKIERLNGWDYWACRTGDGPGIDGAITQRRPGLSGPVNYHNVDDIDSYLDRIEQLGGKTLVPRSPVSAMGWYGLAQDPEGNPIGFWQKDVNAK